MKRRLTCGVLPLLLQIPQHCTHTPLVPIILNFRVIATERKETHFKRRRERADESIEPPLTAPPPPHSQMKVTWHNRCSFCSRCSWWDAWMCSWCSLKSGRTWRWQTCGQTALMCARKENFCHPTTLQHKLSAIMTTFVRLTLRRMIGALWREISSWQCVRGVDATCAMLRIPWHAQCTWIPTRPKGMSRDKSGIQNLAMIYCLKLIIKPANKRAVAVCFQHAPLSYQNLP